MKAYLKKIGAAVLAAFTSSEAVQAEKALAVFVVLRTLLYVGAGAETTVLVKKLVEALLS